MSAMLLRIRYADDGFVKHWVQLFFNVYSMHFACVSLNATELKDHEVFYSGYVNDGRSFQKDSK